MDSVVRQAKALGTYFFIFSGGEPLARKKDVITLCERHPDCAFLSFTNGTLIDDAFADEMLRVKNFVPAISVEGFEQATDARRGEGTYRKVVEAMERLKRKKLAFGVSCCYTSQNAQVIGSDAYFDEMVRLGAKFMRCNSALAAARTFSAFPVCLSSESRLIWFLQRLAHASRDEATPRHDLTLPERVTN